MRSILALSLCLTCLCGAAGALEQSPDAQKAYDEMIKHYNDKDAKPWIAAADFAYQNFLYDKFQEALEKVLTIEPNNTTARARLGYLRVGNEWVKAADADEKEITDNTAKGLVQYGRNWVKPEQAEAQRTAERKVLGWNFDFRVDSRLGFASVYTSGTIEDARKAAAMAETTGSAYWEFYKNVFNLKMPPPLKVFLFKDRATFEDVIAKGTHSQQPLGRSTIGLYSITTKVLYVRMDTGEAGADSYLATEAHEMVHALDDRIAGVFKGSGAYSNPAWMDEGRAEYLGTYSRHGMEVQPGSVNVNARSAIPMIMKDLIAEVQLKKLMGAQGGFMEAESYAVSFALNYYLLHGEGGKYTAAFRRFMALGPGRWSLKDFELTVGKLDVIEPAYKKYVNETLIPLLQAAQKESMDKEEARNEQKDPQAPPKAGIRFKIPELKPTEAPQK